MTYVTLGTMTKPRISTTRELCGLLGTFENASQILKCWNHYFADNDMDAFMDRYPCTTENLPERLSEMFHFDRRFYFVSEPLQKVIVPLLDSCDTDAVNVVINRGGALYGYQMTEAEMQPKKLLDLIAEM